MSKNIVIHEGGVIKQLTVEKLKTNMAGSGDCIWVSKGRTETGLKRIMSGGNDR